MLSTILAQPFFISLLLVGAVLFFIYTLLGTVKVKPLNRLLILIPLLLALSILYMNHNAIVATVLLSTGFLLSFLLAFTMLAK